MSLVRNSAEQGSLDQPTAELVDRSLQFGARSAEEFMTPRSKIESLAADDTIADLLAKVRETGHSRFPVIRGDLDDTLGVVHLKQVFEIPTPIACTPGWDDLSSRFRWCRPLWTAIR